MGNQINSNYAKVNINVDGKKYPVQIDKNLILTKQNYDRKVFSSTSDGQLVEQYYPKNNYGHSVWSFPTEIKFNESEFTLFKNIADNYDEKEAVITLSMKDFDDAIGKYINGEFTADISKNLPEGDFVKREELERDNTEGIFIKSQKGDFLLSIDRYAQKIEDEIAPHIEKSKNNSVNVRYSGDGIQGFDYIDKSCKKYASY